MLACVKLKSLVLYITIQKLFYASAANIDYIFLFLNSLDLVPFLGPIQTSSTISPVSPRSYCSSIILCSCMSLPSISDDLLLFMTPLRSHHTILTQRHSTGQQTQYCFYCKRSYIYGSYFVRDV